MESPATPTTMTERVLREEFPDPDSQALISLCFGEARRTAAAENARDAENLRRAAAGRRVLG